MGRATKKDSTSELKKKLTKRLQQHFEDMLRAEIRWMHGFGKTYRKNGSIIDGNPRNTIDLRNTINKLRVDITGTVNLKIIIRFLGDNAQFIFGEDSTRSEYFDYSLKRLPNYIAALVVELGIEARLGSKSQQITRKLQTAKLKRKSRKK
jgi:hypothetical protein